MQTVSPMSAVRAFAALRIAYGAVSAAATVPMLRAMLRPEEPAKGSVVVFARALGVRDLVFGVGCLLAARDGGGGDNDAAALNGSGSPNARAELRRWLVLWLASDLADVVAGATASQHVGRGGAVAATAVPVPFAAAGLWALRRLPAAE